MYLILLVFPLLSFINLLFFGRFIGQRGVLVISLLNIFLAVFLSSVIFYEVNLCYEVYYLNLFEFLKLAEFRINCSISFDFG